MWWTSRHSLKSEISDATVSRKFVRPQGGADQQRLQISELHLDKFPTSTTFACWIEVCTCSQFPTEATLWIREVEMVESVSRNGNHEDSLWKTKRANSRWLSSRDSKTRVSSRFWQEKSAHPHASHENNWCKGSSGKKNWKIGEKSGMAADKSQK